MVCAMSKSALTVHEARRIAYQAEADPRTVMRYFAGERVQPLSGLRIKRALVKLRIADPNTVAAVTPADAA